MRTLYHVTFFVIISIIASLASQLPPPPTVSDQRAQKEDSSEPPKSKRTPKVIEHIYMNKIRPSRITKKSDGGEKKDNQAGLENSEKSDNLGSPKNEGKKLKEEETDPYICRKMPRLQRVPVCVRLFNLPHYKDELKIKFNYLAYREMKPECVPKKLTFRTPTMSVLYTDIQQEMLPCPGRHHPLRTSWKFDDYRDVFYVSSGVISAPSTNIPPSKDSVPVPEGTEPKLEKTAEEKEPTEADSDFVFEGTDAAVEGTNDLAEGFGSEESEFAAEETDTPVGGTGIAPAPEKSKPKKKKPVPGSLVVYKREWDADTEKFIVYDIIENFKPQNSVFAIVTEYDVEEDLLSMNTIGPSFNNNAAELEAIYIREIWKPLDSSISLPAPGVSFWWYDKIANLYEGELVTLCWVLLNRPQYKDIDFEPQPPPKQMNKRTIVSQQKGLHFEHSVDYNEKSVKQPMYACKPRYKRPLGIINANSERIQISSGARPNSYFIYTLLKGEHLGTYRIFELVENLPIEQGTSYEKYVDVTIEDEATVGSPIERNTEEFEWTFMNVVRQRDVKEDIVCKKLKSGQLRTLCVRLFQTDHYAKEQKIFYNYRLSMRRLESCQKREVTIVSKHLQSTAELYHPMGVCEGRHKILRTDFNLDNYKDLFHVSQGPDENSVMVFRQNNTADGEWFQVYDIVPIENLLELEKHDVSLNAIQLEYNTSLIPSYNSNKPEIEIIYIREMFKSTLVKDTLDKQPEGVMVALCYRLLNRDPYKELNFEISQAALFAERRDIQTFPLAFVHSKEYNDEGVTQAMYPCYGKHADSEVGWRKDKYLHQYRISSGSRPNSYFLYSLLSTENQQRIYTVHEFFENMEGLEKLQPINIQYEKVYKELIRGNSEALGALRKTVDSTKTENGGSKQDERNDVGTENTKNRSTGPKSAELKLAEPEKIVITKPELVEISEDETPNPTGIELEPSEVLEQVIDEKPIIQSNLDESKVEIESSVTEPSTPMKMANKRSHPIEIEQEPPEISKQVIVEEPIIQSNLEESKVEIESTLTEPSTPMKIANMSSNPIEIDQEQPEIPKQVIVEKPLAQSNPNEPNVGTENNEPITINPEIVGVANPVNTKEPEIQTKLDDAIKMAIKNLKSIKTERDKIPAVLKQVISEKLITEPKPDEPTEMNVENAEPVKEETPEMLKPTNAKGRKTWGLSKDPIQMAETIEEMPEKFKPTNTKVRKTWEISKEPIQMTGNISREPKKMTPEKSIAAKGKQAVSPTSKLTNHGERITWSKSRPINTEIPTSEKSEIEKARDKVRSSTSKNRVTRPAVSKPVKTDVEKPPFKTGTSIIMKPNPSLGFAPSTVRAARRVNHEDVSDLHSVAVY